MSQPNEHQTTHAQHNQNTTPTTTGNTDSSADSNHTAAHSPATPVPNELKQRQKPVLSPLNVRRLSTYAAHNDAAEFGDDEGVAPAPAPPLSTTNNINAISNNNNNNTNNNNNYNNNNNNTSSTTSSSYATPPIYQQQLSTMTTTTPLDSAIDDKYKLFAIYNGNGE